MVINFQNSVQSFGRGTYPISSPLSPALKWLRRAMLRRSNERSPIRPRTDPRSEITIPSSANGDSQVHAQTTPSSSAKVLGLKGDKKQNYNPSSTSPPQHHWTGKWKKYWSSWWLILGRNCKGMQSKFQLCLVLCRHQKKSLPSINLKSFKATDRHRPVMKSGSLSINMLWA